MPATFNATVRFCLLATVATLYCARADAAQRTTYATSFSAAASPAPVDFPAANTAAPVPYKLVGGGAQTNYSGFGNLLTQTSPGAPGSNSWAGAGKDHLAADPSTLTVYGVALLDPEDDYEVGVFSANSGFASHPTATAILPPGYALTGGGCTVNWQLVANFIGSTRTGSTGAAPALPAGNLLTASFPSSLTTWQCDSKDHGVASPATITAYVVGIRPKKVWVPMPLVQITMATSPVGSHPMATARVVPGAIVTGGGARALPADPAGAGQLLVASVPSATVKAPNLPIGWTASSKDHAVPSPGTVTAYAVNLTFPAPILGFADLHTHQFGNLAFGGKAVWGQPFGPASDALQWCGTCNPFDPAAGIRPHGCGPLADFIGSLVSWLGDGGPIHGPNLGGYPQFDGWPSASSVDHQQMWEQWLRRAHDGGLQLMVMHAVNNVHLCSVVTKAPNRTCDDREAIQYQIDGARAMQAYIDNQSGGPGRGWYRIVYSPAEARQAIAAGQLAVVLGVEVDHPFPTANPGEALAQLNAYYQLGIRHLFPVHFEDNEVGGSAYDKLVLDRDVATVPPGGVVPKPWSPTMALGAGTVADVLPLYYFSVRNCGPPYRIDGGRCNARGLAPGVGTAVIRGLMNKGMLIDIDHMSELTFFGTMDLLDAQHYPAVSGHTGFVDLAAPGPGGDSKAHEGSMTLDKLRRVQRSGGMVALIASQGSVSSIATFRGGPVVVEHACGSTSETVAQAYLYAATYAPGMAVGIGTDMNGFLAMPGGRFGPAACGGKAPPNPNPHPIGVQYPFTAIATGRSLGISRAVEGDPQVTRTFDFNSEGLAHIGLLPDLIEDLRKLGIPDATLQPMLSSAEGYLRAWESALANRLPDESPLCGKARSQGLAPPTGCWY